MPDTLVPPEVFVHPELYAGIQTFIGGENERLQMFTEVIDAFGVEDTRMRILSSLKVSLADNQIGTCLNCYDASKLYIFSVDYKTVPTESALISNISHTITEYPEFVRFTTTHGMCSDCLKRMVMYYATFNMNRYMWGQSAYSMIMPSAMFPEPTVEYHTCDACHDVLLTENNAGEIMSGARGPVTAIDGSSNEHKVHYNCSWQCDGCNQRYIAYYRNRELSVTQFTLDGNPACASCIGDTDQYSVCDNCSSYITGDPIWSEARGEDLCERCYETPLECGDCGWEYNEGDDHYCNSEDESCYVHNYSYKPRPIFFGDDRVYMGVELEVEASQRRSNLAEGAEYVVNFSDNDKRLYLKSDGSLSYGFEIVTHPHSLDEYHKLDLSWMDRLRTMGYRSWDASSCGIHVHVGLTAFINENHQIRFTKFIYDNERQVKRISGRSSSYASFTDKGRAVSKIKNKHHDTNRYSAVNVQNDTTLEVRVFKGSLRKERLLSAIEFVHAVVEYTRTLAIVPKDKPFSWAKFVAYVANNSTTYPNLFIIMNETFDNDNLPTTEEDN